MQRITGDRFYDDDDKKWYIYYDKGNPMSFVGVLNGVIKNVWGEDKGCLIEVLKEVNKKESIQESVVPVVFQKEYEVAGFDIIGNGYKNFIRIRGAENE
ncbi:hypothetical protein [Heyndrickxia sporothermodurans]|uniref:hypothetical protein n=1 Tax=Heyndrickxia sporothermodurans TaxID=46224 RepID=UPI0035E2D0FA